MAKLNLRTNRKFRRLLAMVRVDAPEHLLGHLAALWEATWQNGTPLVGDLQDIEAAAGWTMADTEKYPPGAFAAAMVLARLVDTVAEGELYAVHDWYDHAPEYVKKRIGRAVKDDPTVGHETFFLGIDTWIRRSRELGLPVDARQNDSDTGELDLDADLPSDEDCQRGGRNRVVTQERPPKPSSYSETAAYRVEPSRAEPSQAPERISPPSSPPSLFSTARTTGEQSSADLRTAMSRVTDAVVRLTTLGDKEASELLEDQAMDCRSLSDWTALAEVATEALQRSTRTEALA